MHKRSKSDKQFLEAVVEFPIESQKIEKLDQERRKT